MTANTGWSLASFLLGFPASGDLQVPTAPSLQFSYVAGYVQDDWRVTDRLTLNIGFRYDVETPYTERYNRISYFDPALSSGATKLVPTALGGLAFPERGRQPPRYRQNINLLRPGPRAGLAYKMTGSLVLRAAYGIIYPPSLAQGYNAPVFGYQPWLGDTPFVASADGGLTPSGSLSNPFPNGLNQPPGSALGSSALLGQSITTQLKQLPAPYTQQYNLGFQQQIRSWLLDVGYVGAHGVHQLINAPMDQLLPSQYALGNALNTQVPNPFLGLVSIGSFANPTFSVGQLLKPFPQFTDIQNGDENVGSWLYNSLQVKGERRFANGFGILASFTWSKEIGDTTGSHYYAANSVQNEYNLAAERSLEVFNIPRRLTVAYLWELPFGKGHRFLNSVPSGVNRLVTGWQINGLTTLQDGMPTIINNTSNVVGFGAGSRPNNNGTSALLPSSQRTASRWFNTSVFSLPPQYTFGNVGPTSPDLRGQGVNNWNVSLSKSTPIREGANLEFRGEFDNFFNHPLWASPNGTVGSPTFGVVSSKTGNRVGQLALQARLLIVIAMNLRRAVIPMLVMAPACATANVDFQRDVRPILASNCFQCHGPDTFTRQAGLRLDTRDGLFADRKSGPAVVLGKPEASRLYQRISEPKPALRMPPPQAHKDLTATQIGTLRAWIEQGPVWGWHRAFAAPWRTDLPLPGSCRNAQMGAGSRSDRVCASFIEAEGLHSAPWKPETRRTSRARVDLARSGGAAAAVSRGRRTPLGVTATSRRRRVSLSTGLHSRAGATCKRALLARTCGLATPTRTDYMRTTIARCGRIATG